MKHLQGFNELYKSTYLRASNALKQKEHKKRSEEIHKHAQEKGKDFQRERIYPHRFILDYDDEPGEYYFITEIEFHNTDRTISQNFLRVTMESNWGKKYQLYIHLNLSIHDENLYLIGSKVTLEGVRYRFKGRKQAVHFLKAIRMFYEDEKSSITEKLLSIGYRDSVLEKLRDNDVKLSLAINDFYSSD